MAKIKKIICKHCGMPTDEPRKHIPKVGLLRIGRAIYWGILGDYYESMELCNFCYTTMQSYRHTLSEEERKHYEKTRHKLERGATPK